MHICAKFLISKSIIGRFESEYPQSSLNDTTISLYFLETGTDVPSISVSESDKIS